MYCPNCGKELPNGSHFCSGCGYEVSKRDNSQKQFRAPTARPEQRLSSSAPHKASKIGYFERLKLGLLSYMACCGVTVLYALLILEYKFHFYFEVIHSIVIIIVIAASGVIVNVIFAVSAFKMLNTSFKHLKKAEEEYFSSAEINKFKHISKRCNAIASFLLLGAIIIVLLRYLLA